MGLRSIVLVLGLATLSLLPRGAQAYVREVTKSGVPVAWRYPCVTMQIYLGSAPPVLTADAYFAASAQAAGVWSYPTLTCTDIRLAMVAEAQASADVGHDSKNVVTFRQDTWCRQPAPVDDAGTPQPDCYPSSALAITSIFKNSKTGEILDADIEFNAVYYSWGDLEGQPALATSETADFQNALTHELGHVLGLDHNCFTTNDAQARLNDNTGAPEVDCNSTRLDAILNATMYPSVLLGDTQRRTLSLDDEQGVCDIYPHLHDVCPVPPTDSGCSVLTTDHPHHSQTALLCTTLGLLVAALAVLRNRPRV